MTFIVRAAADDAGHLSGIVERVRTGAKERFDGVEAIGLVIARLVGEERARAGSRDEAPSA